MKIISCRQFKFKKSLAFYHFSKKKKNTEIFLGIIIGVLISWSTVVIFVRVSYIAFVLSIRIQFYSAIPKLPLLVPLKWTGSTPPVALSSEPCGAVRLGPRCYQSVPFSCQSHLSWSTSAVPRAKTTVHPYLILI